MSAALTDRRWLWLCVCCVAAIAWVASPSGASVTSRDLHQPILLHDVVSRDGLQAHEAWAVTDRMSGGERLWYRVGARIESRAGRPALVQSRGAGLWR